MSQHSQSKRDEIGGCALTLFAEGSRRSELLIDTAPFDPTVVYLSDTIRPRLEAHGDLHITGWELYLRAQYYT